MTDEIVEGKTSGEPEITLIDAGNEETSNNIGSEKAHAPTVPSDSIIMEKKDINHPVPVVDRPGDKIVNAVETIPRKSRSPCRARSRDLKKCQTNFRDIIGKHETRNEELEQLEGDLRERLDMLECSMPAVMVWNILRMTEGAPSSAIRQLMEKQFQGINAADNVAIANTPSQHYDCRVREIEAERKRALRRAEEARALLTDREAAVEDRLKRLEEAKRCNQERKERVEKLNLEAAQLREAMRNARGDDGSSETETPSGIRCKEKLLDRVGSLSSIGSTDLECFAKLQELAESEVCMRRQISELERREEVYMRTLQQADELWSKMAGNNLSNVTELQEQLDMKTAANQQLADRICQLEDESEIMKKRLISCSEELNKFTEKTYTDAEAGLKNGIASVANRGIVAAVKTATLSSSASPEAADADVTARPETVDKDASHMPESNEKGVRAHTKMFDKDSEAVVDRTDREVDAPTGLGIDTAVGHEQVLQPNDPSRMVDSLRKLRTARPNETEPEDEEDVPEAWKNWNWDEGCPPNATCTYMVESSIGTDNAQLVTGTPTIESEVQATVKMVERSVGGRETKDIAEIIPEVKEGSDLPSATRATIAGSTDKAAPESTEIVLSREELRNWYNVVNSIHHTISRCVNCTSRTDATNNLMEKMRNHLRMIALVDEEEPVISEKSMVGGAEILTEIPREHSFEPDDTRHGATPSDVKARPTVEAIGSTDSNELDDDTSSVHGKEIAPSNGQIDTIDISDVQPTILSEVESDVSKLTVTLGEFPEKIKPQKDDTDEKLGDDDQILPRALTRVPSQDDRMKAVVQIRRTTYPDQDQVEKELPERLEGQQAQQPMDPNVRVLDAPDAVLEDSSHIQKDYTDPRSDITVPQVSESPKESTQDLPVLREASMEFAKSPDQPERSLADIPEPIPTKQPITGPTALGDSVVDREIPPGASPHVVSQDKIEDVVPLIMETKETEEESLAVMISAKEPDIPPDKQVSEKNIQIFETPDPLPERSVIPSSEEPSTLAEKQISVIDNQISDTSDQLPGKKSKPSTEEPSRPADERVSDPNIEISNISDALPGQSVEPGSEGPTRSAEEQVSDPNIERSNIPDPSPRQSVKLASEEPTWPAEEPVSDLNTRKTDGPVPLPEQELDMTKEHTDVSEDKTVDVIFEKSIDEIKERRSVSPSADETEGVAEAPDAIIESADPREMEKPGSSSILTSSPSSAIDPKRPETPEPKESLGISDEPELPSSPDVITALTPLSELKMHPKPEESPSIGSRTQDAMDGILGGAIQPASLPSLEKSEALVEPVTKEIEYKEPSVTIFSKGERRDSAEPTVPKEEETSESEMQHEVSEVSPSDGVILGESAEKLPAKILSERKSIQMSEQEPVDTTLPSTSEVEPERKLRPPKLTEPCTLATCTPSIKPLRNVDTDGTQTSPQFPRTLNRIKLKMITEDTCRSPDVVMWRRPLIWSRRRKDKSMLTTTCVDTQTESGLSRGRITHRRLDRKDDHTCCGIGPSQTEFGRSDKRAPSRHLDKRLLTLASLNAADFSRRSGLPPSSTSAEKEVSVMDYMASSLGVDELSCVGCGKPITSKGTPSLLKTNVRGSAKPQKSLMQSLKKIATGSTSRMARKRDDSTCCDCQKLEKPKTKDKLRAKREPEKTLDDKTSGNVVCCPCPTEVEQKMAVTSSKASRKRRKPETKDQSITAYIPRGKLKKVHKEKKAIDASHQKDIIEKSCNESCAFTEGGSKTVTLSPKIALQTSPSSTKIGSKQHDGCVAHCMEEKPPTRTSRPKADGPAEQSISKTSSGNETPQCACPEDCSVANPYTNYSSIFKTNISKGECPSTCSCSSVESGSKKKRCCE